MRHRHPRPRPGMRRPIFLFILLALFVAPAKATAASYDIAVTQAQASIVFVEGAESGTGFTLRNRGSWTYVLTSAHLLEKDRYDANAASLAGLSKKSAADWLTVYDPRDGKPYAAEIVGAPDFVNDFVVLKVNGMPKRPHTLCLASIVPANVPFAVSSFDVDVLDNPPFGNKLTPFSSLGISTTPVRVGSNEFQYATAIEKGFSGGPIYDTDSGAVFGIVRRSPYVPDPTTGAIVVSANSHYGVSISAVATYVRSLEPIEPGLADLAPIDERDHRKIVPKLSGAIRLIAFDNVRSGESLHPVFRAYDTQIRSLLGNRFGNATQSAEIDPETTVKPPDTSLTSIPHICQMKDGTDAAGVVALRRDLRDRPRVLSARVALVACNGHIIDRSTIETSTMDENGPSDEQVRAFIAHLGAALDRLTNGNDERLANFAADGLPLANGESRAFFEVRHDGPNAYLTYAWAGGSAAAISVVARERALVALSGLSSDALQTLTAADLDRLLDSANAEIIAKFAASDGSTMSASLATNDRCTYLRRRKVNAAVDFVSGPMKAEIL